MSFFTRKLCTRNDELAGALSWCSTQLWFIHNWGLFPAYSFPHTLQNCYVTSGISLIVKQRVWRIRSRTASMWTSVDMEDRPHQGSSSIDILPVLKRLYHSKHCIRPIHSSPKAFWSIFHVSVAVFPEFEAKFHTHTFFQVLHFHRLKKSQAGHFTCLLQWL